MPLRHSLESHHPRPPLARSRNGRERKARPRVSDLILTIPQTCLTPLPSRTARKLTPATPDTDTLSDISALLAATTDVEASENFQAPSTCGRDGLMADEVSGGFAPDALSMFLWRTPYPAMIDIGISAGWVGDVAGNLIARGVEWSSTVSPLDRDDLVLRKEIEMWLLVEFCEDCHGDRRPSGISRSLAPGKDFDCTKYFKGTHEQRRCITNY
ncbi:uncharacterized protein N7482_003716 [Penicillium canariense]|uniref:Uncharacterized protein n=1 Tax=Penicillium canariense TaxID=189055 RepID=A0A9W9IAX7_9EURO|nr:uncharacterized protein N7482_003716 [Penicillium canariense]KAJ5168122.1 hypothetical protein N7482_003716 [Penicillium canariense]